MAKILIVDDDITFLSMMNMMLSASGYDVIETSVARRVPAILENEAPDLVITDIVMPDCEGFETIMSIRRTNPKLPIIAISGNNLDYLQMTLDVGANDILVKPIAQADLIKMVQQYI